MAQETIDLMQDYRSKEMPYQVKANKRTVLANLLKDKAYREALPDKAAKYFKEEVMKFIAIEISKDNICHLIVHASEWDFFDGLNLACKHNGLKSVLCIASLILHPL